MTRCSGARQRGLRCSVRVQRVLCDAEVLGMASGSISVCAGGFLGCRKGKGWRRSLHLCLLWRWNGPARGRHRKPALCRRLGGGWPCSEPWRSSWHVPQPHRVTGTGRQSPRSPGRAAAGARRGEEVTVPMAQRCGSCAVCATGGSCWPRGREGRSRSVCERERSCYVCEGSRDVREELIPGRAAPVARV